MHVFLAHRPYLLCTEHALTSRDGGMQTLLVGLPLTALVAGLALALWRLAGPVSLRPETH